MCVEKKVMVEIFGEQYPLITDGDEAHIRRLAAIVDQKVREIARKSTNLSGQRLGVLAALQIAEEYSQMKKDYDDLVAMLDRKR
ncbi:MAG: cell division protein ZapA [Schwartzia sp.]|nr:cell division protein ZapA [Schwartzia sp. (in: firmicutes)]